MKEILSKYMWLFVEVLVSMYSVAMVISIYKNVDLINGPVGQSLQSTIVTDGIAVEYEVNDVEESSFEVVETILELNSVFDWKEHVRVTDSRGNDLMNYVVVTGEVNTAVAGNYKMSFILNWNGKCLTKDVVFYVNE